MRWKGDEVGILRIVGMMNDARWITMMTMIFMHYRTRGPVSSDDDVRYHHFNRVRVIKRDHLIHSMLSSGRTSLGFYPLILLRSSSTPIISTCLYAFYRKYWTGTGTPQRSEVGGASPFYRMDLFW